MAKANEALLTQEQERQALEIYNALNQNNDLFEQKIQVNKLKKVDGKVRNDKDGNPMYDEFGEVMKWDDSYSMTYVALNSGGEHTARITQEQYLNLKEGEIYVASGKIEYRLYKDSFNSTPIPVFNKFIPASELFVAAMLKLQAGKA